MKSTSGKRIFTGSLAAASRAHWRRLVRISSATVLRTRPIGMPRASAWVSVSTKFDSSGTSVRFFRFCRASRRGRPSSISRRVRANSSASGLAKFSHTMPRAPSKPMPASTEMARRSSVSGRSFLIDSVRSSTLRSTQLFGSWTPAIGRTTATMIPMPPPTVPVKTSSRPSRRPTRPPSAWRLMISSARNWFDSPARTSWWCMRSR
jgi:hypothetical protein